MRVSMIVGSARRWARRAKGGVISPTPKLLGKDEAKICLTICQCKVPALAGVSVD